MIVYGLTSQTNPALESALESVLAGKTRFAIEEAGLSADGVNNEGLSSDHYDPSDSPDPSV